MPFLGLSDALAGRLPFALFDVRFPSRCVLARIRQVGGFVRLSLLKQTLQKRDAPATTGTGTLTPAQLRSSIGFLDTKVVLKLSLGYVKA